MARKPRRATRATEAAPIESTPADPALQQSTAESPPLVAAIERGARVRAIAAWMLVMAALPMAFHYFSRPGASDVAKAHREIFWQGMDLSWLETTSAELRAAALDRDPDPFEIILLRAALARWRVRGLSERSYDLLFERWERGWWTIPPKAEWDALMAEIDQRWLDARSSALMEGVTSPRVAIHRQGDLVALRFEPPVETTHLGSAIKVVWETERAGLPVVAPEVGWITDRAAASPYQRRVGLWNALAEQGTDGKDRFEIELDFSWEPVWLRPGTRVGALVFKVPGGARWDLVRMNGVDSPLLAPQDRLGGDFPSGK